MPNYGRVLALSWADRCLLLETAVAYVLVQIGLRYCSFRRLHRWLTCGAFRLPTWRGQVAVREVRWTVRTMTSVLPGETTCLIQAMTATAVCRCYDLPANLRVGATTDPGHYSFRAHAWVDVDGETIGTPMPRETHLPINEGL
jgi:hypothetical protein